jgi:predicted ATPase
VIRVSEGSVKLLRIKGIRLKNFKSFRNSELSDVQTFTVLIDANGTGESTIFSVLSMLQEAMSNNVNTALSKFGGIKELRTRDVPDSETVEIILEFCLDPGQSDKPSLLIYNLELNEKDGRAYVEHEALTIVDDLPAHSELKMIEFCNGRGKANGNLKNVQENNNTFRGEALTLKSKTFWQSKRYLNSIISLRSLV